MGALQHEERPFRAEQSSQGEFEKGRGTHCKVGSVGRTGQGKTMALAIPRRSMRAMTGQALLLLVASTLASSPFIGVQAAPFRNKPTP